MAIFDAPRDQHAGLTGRQLRELWYAPLLALAMGLMLARLLLMARWLDLPAFASYSAALLVSSSFCMLVCLGLQPMLQRDLPMLIVRRRERRGVTLAAQCAIVAIGCAGLGVLASAAGVAAAGLSPTLFALGVLHGLSQQLFVVATVDSRSRGRPLRFAAENFGRAALILMCGWAAAAVTRSPTWVLLVEALLSTAIAASLLSRQLRRPALPCGAAWRIALRRLPAVRWNSALALLAVSAIAFVLINIDRWVAAQWLSPRHFALYAFAWTLLMVAQSTQVIVASALYPLLARRFAEAGVKTAFGLSARASLGLLAAAGAAAAPVWWMLDAAIARWFEDYSQARSLLAPFLLVAALRVSDFWSSFLLVVGRETRLLVLQLAAAAVALPVWWGLVAATGAQDLGRVALLAVVLGCAGYVACAAAAWLTARGAA